MKGKSRLTKLLQCTVVFAMTESLLNFSGTWRTLKSTYHVRSNMTTEQRRIIKVLPCEDQRSILGVKPAAPSDIAGLCKNIAHPVSHSQTSLS